MVEVPATMTKLAEAMTAVVKLVEAQVERGAASGPSAYDVFEQSRKEAVGLVQRPPTKSALTGPRQRRSGTDDWWPDVPDGAAIAGDYHARAGSVSVTRTLIPPPPTGILEIPLPGPTELVQ